jgi:predicted dehydrogenase
MGIQNHANDNYRRVVEIIQSGAVGPVREVHVWVSRAWGLQSPEAAKRNQDIITVMDRPRETTAVPPGLDWDLWLGPAPARPFSTAYVPGPRWYRWWDFGNGTMSDLGSHWNDLPFWALRLRAPLTVEASGPPPHREIAPASMSATYEYGPRGDMPPVKLVWHQGEHKPEIWKKRGIPQWTNGILFVGSRGMLLADYGRHLLLPEKAFADYRPPTPTLPRLRGPNAHHLEWVRACKAGQPASANFEYSGWLTEANHLGNVAYRVGKKIEWDADNLRCRNAPEAEAFIRRAYRKGWEL